MNPLERLLGLSFCDLAAYLEPFSPVVLPTVTQQQQHMLPSLAPH